MTNKERKNIKNIKNIKKAKISRDIEVKMKQIDGK